MVVKSVQALLKSKKIYEIVNPKCIQGNPDISIREAVQRMRNGRSGYVVIVEQEEVVGIFTETDLLHKVLGKKIDWSKPVHGVMTENPLVLTRNDSVGAAIDLMGRHSFYHIPLVNKNHKIAGILSVRTLIRFLAEFYPAEVFNLPPDPNQIMKTVEGG